MWNGIRETIGWIITLIGLSLVGVVLMMAINRSVFEAIALSLPSAIVFRGGIGLIRMSAATRIAKQLGRE
ncbi:MAG: hypothetical protein AB8B55_12905 [Mariniblastus sp.]